MILLLMFSIFTQALLCVAGTRLGAVDENVRFLCFLGATREHHHTSMKKACVTPFWLE